MEIEIWKVFLFMMIVPALLPAILLLHLCDKLLEKFFSQQKKIDLLNRKINKLIKKEES